MNRKKNRKLLFQIGIVLIPLFLLALGGVYYVIQNNSINSYLDAKNPPIEEALGRMHSGACNSLLGGFEWIIDEWEKDPVKAGEGYTDGELNANTSFRYVHKYVMPPEEESVFVQQEPELRNYYIKSRRYDIELNFEYLSDNFHSEKLFMIDVNGDDLGLVFAEYSQSDDRKTIGDRYNIDLKEHPAIKQILESSSEEIVFERTDDYQFGETSYIGYKPFYVNGQLRAVLGTVYSWKDFKTALVGSVRKASLFGLGVTAVAIGIIFLIFYLRALKPLAKIQGIVREYTGDKDSGNALELVSRIPERNEIGRLADDFSEMVKEIDAYTEEIRRVTAEKEHLEGQLEMAVRLKLALMPTVFPAFPEFKTIDLYADMLPIDRIGGDFYDFFRIDESHIAVVIANIFDGGTVSALFMVAFKIILRHYAEFGLTPREVINALNNRLFRENEDDLTLSCWYGVVDVNTGDVTAVNAGHEAPVIIGRDGVHEIENDVVSWIVGMIEGLDYDEYSFKLEKGEGLFLYTGGVTEAADSTGAVFGIERLEEKLNGAAGAEHAVALVQGAISEFEGDTPPDKDATMMCLMYGKGES